MDVPDLDFLKGETDETAIPIPSLDFAREIRKIEPPKTPEGLPKPVTKLDKYQKQYEAFCRWSGTPPEERKPKTQLAFEKRWGLPKNYTSAFFKTRPDYRNKTLTYLWDWMLEHLPEVVYRQYKKAIVSGSDNAAKFFAELIEKQIDVNKPEQRIQPIIIVGVDPKRLDALTQPEGYDKIEDVVPE